MLGLCVGVCLAVCVGVCEGLATPRQSREGVSRSRDALSALTSQLPASAARERGAPSTLSLARTPTAPWTSQEISPQPLSTLQQLPAQTSKPASASASANRHRTRITPGLRSRLTAYSSRLRSRQVARRVPTQRPLTRRLIGPNVCGRQCCRGWTLNPGTNRCMKPVCDPPCQNRASCSRPQVCVCRSGFQGSRCEEVVPEQQYVSSHRGRPQRFFSSSLSGSYANMVRRIGNPAKNKSAGESTSTSRRTTSTGDESHASQMQSRRAQQTNSQQLLGTSRTVKHVSNGNGLLLSNALPNVNSQTYVNNRFTANGQRSTDYYSAQTQAANLTTSVDRIKIVFTPTICKRNCKNGKCHNNCRKGVPTTIYSGTGYGPVSKSGFRIYFCQIPCLNGGHCIGRDKCWCPSNSTGKFCHLPVPPEKRTPTKPAPVNSASQSVYTLPLSNQQVVMLPSLVNIHVNHPPEASVQIHQVARVRDGPHPSDQNSIETSQDQESVRSVQQRSQPNDATKENARTQPPAQATASSVGRCFQETVDGQCGKPLPGLTKQDDCCGSVGMSWGYHKCTQCPPKPAYPKIENGHLECPLGYKKRNVSHCEDINECLIVGICQHANCLNTRGSYRCTCKPGYMMDRSRSHCISDKAVSSERGLCFRSLSGGNCSLPLTHNIPKQICCCSRVGKGWGRNCEKCPLPGSVVFSEICPAGHGYHYSRSDIQISLRPTEDQDLVHINSEQHFGNREGPVKDISSAEQLGITRVKEHGSFIKLDHPSVPGHNPSVDIYPVEVAVRTSTPSPVHLIPDTDPDNAAAEEFSVTDPCVTSLNICGPGRCISKEGSYTCRCHPGYHLDSQQTKCVDADECQRIPQPCNYGKCVNTAGGYWCTCSAGFRPNQQGTECLDMDECEQDPCEGKGHCVNLVGTHSCACFTGYTSVILQGKRTCQDINECEQPTLCRRGQCTNTEGSYRCDCHQGYIMTGRGQCDDIDECRNPTACPTGRCINTLGSFDCVSCPPGYKAQNGRCLDVNECLTSGVCANGKCVNLVGSYRCICNQGFKLMADNKSCRDFDECVSLNICPNALCTNTEGSYTCTPCPAGYGVSEGACQDVDECAFPSVCPDGICSNTDGSHTCSPCGPGYRVSEDRRRCEDVNECLTGDICSSNRECMNTNGSYFCVCAKGYTASPDGKGCQDVNECLTSDICGPNGECINNEDGSYHCLCAQGYTTSLDGTACQDVDECTEDARCLGGQCLNTDGSYMCKCETGFTHLSETEDCVDIDECSIYGSSVCGMWKCENTIGSYQCIMECQPGFQHTSAGDCADVNECLNETICSVHEYCENTVGYFRCVCDRGYEKPPGERRCVDINECEMMNRACGAALCENFEGSFFCVCRDEDQEFDPVTSECITPTGQYVTGEETEPAKAINLDLLMRPGLFNRDRKDCYYNLNDANFCDNVLAQNITKAECCCTVGAGWGDNCEVHPCPIFATDEYEEVCPDGKGIIPFGNYEDADECEMFESEICKNGRCVNTVRHYACYCHTGFHYDTVRLECIDNDECQDENTCVNGECVNTPGSFNCFCSPPLILDITRKKCINGTGLTVDLFEERNVHQGICWQEVGESFICSRPLMTRQTTYTECCCLYGEAWGLECAFCPFTESDDFAQLCNIPRTPGDGSTGTRDRPGFEYSPEGPQYGQEIQQGAETYYNYLQHEYGPYDAQHGPEYGPRVGFGEAGVAGAVPDPRYGSREDLTNPQYELREPQAGLAYGPRETPWSPEYGPRVPQNRPRETERIAVFRDNSRIRYDSFEGLQAEECGILNGCENGRCVRVREGYTCDCFDGYKFDTAKMVCADINECDDVSDTIPLCRNAKCENTEGSYSCHCLPGYTLSRDRNDCQLKTEAAEESQ